jgi:hypothetical protein
VRRTRQDFVQDQADCAQRDRAFGHVEGPETPAAVVQLDEIDDVAVKQPVDDVAEGAAHDRTHREAEPRLRRGACSASTRCRLTPPAPGFNENRVLRQLLALIQGTLRTNHWHSGFGHSGTVGPRRSFLRFKFDLTPVPGRPSARPLYEIFVWRVGAEPACCLGVGREAAPAPPEHR